MTRHVCKRLELPATTTFLLFFLSTALSQYCEEWNGEPDFCAQFDVWSGDGVRIYVPEGEDFFVMQETVKQIVNIVGSLKDDGSIETRCGRYWARLACATYLRPCPRVPQNITDNNDSFLVTPIQPCSSTCFDYIQMCSEYLKTTGFPIGMALYFPPGFEPPMMCNETDTNGAPFYQSNSYNVSLSTNNQTENSIVLECNGIHSNSSTVVICGDPLRNVENKNACGFTCPLPAYSDSQYDGIKVLQLVLGWLSWAGSLIVVLSYALHNKLRKFPSNLILMAAVAAHLESVGMILPTFFGYDNTWCGFDTVYLMPEFFARDTVVGVDFKMEEMAVHSGLCTFQGWLVQMGFLSSTMWWGIVAFNMFLSVFFGSKLPDSKVWMIGLQVVFHVCGWAVPAFLMMIPAAADKIAFAPGASLYCPSPPSGFSPYRSICLMVQPNFDDDMQLFIGFGGCAFFGVLGTSSRHYPFGGNRSVRRFIDPSSALKKTCGTYLRVVLFIFIYLVLIAFIFAYSLRVVTAKDTIEDGYSEYYLCLLFRLPHCSLSEEVHNYGLAVLRSIGYSSLGLMLFFNFCFSPSMGRFWWRFFNNVRQGKFSNVFTSEKTPTGKSPVGKKSKSTETNEVMTMSVDFAEEEFMP
ncbi:hypothetical protein QOT17_011154 [Balamuthia mandrillaris]